jgi:hypothetical protein
MVYTGCSTMSFTPTAAARVEHHVGGVDQLGQELFVLDRVDV